MDRRRRLREGVLSLSVVQAATLLIPLVQLPFLVRSLGADQFGKLVFVQAAYTYVVLLSDYGFNLSGTRSIARARYDEGRRSRIIASTYASKSLLTFVGLLVVVAVVLLVPSARADWKLWLCGSVVVFGSLLLPQWLFQGLELMREFAVVVLVSRAISLGLVILTVQRPADVNLAALAQGSWVVLAGLYGASFALRELGKPVSIGWSDVKNSLRDGWSLFVASASVTLYTTGNVLVLGLVTSPYQVAVYSVSEKVCRAAAGLFSPVVQAVYPRVSALTGAQDSTDGAGASLHRVFLWTWTIGLGISLPACLTLFFGAPTLLRLIGGSEFTDSDTISIAVFSLLPLVLVFNSIWGTLIMATHKLDRLLGRIILSAGSFNVVLVLIGGAEFGSFGAALSVLATEVLLTAAMGLTIRLRSSAALLPGWRRIRSA